MIQYLKLAMARGMGVRDGVAHTRWSLSVDAETKPDLWLRLPRWMSWPLIRLWLKRFPAASRR